MNVERWLRSSARDTVTGPSGMLGTSGVSWMERKLRAFPRAAMVAAKARVLDCMRVCMGVPVIRDCPQKYRLLPIN
jgi:hypothetical protein